MKHAQHASGMFQHLLADDAGGAVLRAIVYEDELAVELAGLERDEHPLCQLGQVQLLVETRNDDRQVDGV